MLLLTEHKKFVQLVFLVEKCVCQVVLSFHLERERGEGCSGVLGNCLCFKLRLFKIILQSSSATCICRI